jgi:hypothetical protein
MDKQFKDLYKVGDFVVCHNMICIVTSYADKMEKWMFDTPAPGYKLASILNVNFLDRVFIIHEDDLSFPASEEFLLESMTSLVETSLEIDDIDVHISDTNIMLGQDDGYIDINPEQALKLRDIIDVYVEEL